jgi:hypothetical protein
MNPEPYPWKKMAAAARRSGEGKPECSTAAAPSEISWLPQLAGKVHARFLRLIWRRWAIAAILISAALLAAAWIDARGIFPAGTDTALPRIPIPSAP